jgi:hypothetical protein
MNTVKKMLPYIALAVSILSLVFSSFMAGYTKGVNDTVIEIRQLRSK